MSEQPTPSEPHESSVTQNVSGGVTVRPGGDANVSGDVVGRDKVTTTTTVTNVGMTPEAARRLVITVGVLALATAFCSTRWVRTRVGCRCPQVLCSL